MNGAQAYGLWGLVILNSVVFILFALSFAPPQSARGWRTFGFPRMAVGGRAGPKHEAGHG